MTTLKTYYKDGTSDLTEYDTFFDALVASENRLSMTYVEATQITTLEK